MQASILGKLLNILSPLKTHAAFRTYLILLLPDRGKNYET